jgi:hypothetical protein
MDEQNSKKRPRAQSAKEWRKGMFSASKTPT